MSESDDKEKLPVVVVMVPLPAQSHMNQLLQLSCLLSSYNIPVHYAGSALHNHQIRLRAASFDRHQIHFHDFPLPPFASPDPDPTVHNFPSHLNPSFKATVHLREPIFGLLRQLSTAAHRLVVIFDSLMAYVVQDAVSLCNAETYIFRPISAFTSFFFLWEAFGKPFETEVPVPNGGLPTMDGCFTSDILEFFALQFEFSKSRSGDLWNTSRLIEATYLDLLDRVDDHVKEKWGIGPLHVQVANRDSGNSTGVSKQREEHMCLKWLDKQPPNSVILVSFGTSTSLSDEQIEEIARGLEESKTRFLWVLRDADKGDASMPMREATGRSGGRQVEERVGGATGMVERGWAPQLEILAHPATGGFMTHCGWNSCLEGICARVPVAAWPMHSDQPRNAVLMTEVLRVGLLVRDWDSRGEIVKASVVKESVMRLMGSEEGEGIRKRAMELGSVVNQGADEGGISRIQLESFIAHIKRKGNDQE